jgi:hypothetical protein
MPTLATYLERKLRRLFPNAQDRRIVSAELHRYGVSASEPEPERVRLAALKLAGRNLQKLRQTIDGAKEDWEDIVNWAERPRATQSQLTNRKLNEVERRKIDEEDGKEWEQWLDTTTSWKPDEFEVGDRVVNPSHADWGVGIVVRAELSSDLTFADGTVWRYHPKSVGQHLAVRFADGRTRTIITSSTPLKRA